MKLMLWFVGGMPGVNAFLCPWHLSEWPLVLYAELYHRKSVTLSNTCKALVRAGVVRVGIALQGREEQAEFWEDYSRTRLCRERPLFRVLSTNVHTSHFQALMCILRPQNQLCLKFVCARFIEKVFPTRRGESQNHREKANFLLIWLDGQWSSIQETR